MATLHLICGLPGSGKTTLSRKLEQTLPALRLSADDLTIPLVGTVFDEQKDAAAKDILAGIAARGLALGVDVILEGGFWYKAERDAARTMAETVGARTVVHFLDVPVEEIIRRVEARNAALHQNTYRITAEQLRSWAAHFEVPTSMELELTDSV
jgi:hypothetical protein